jgi:hypothetical protein
LPEKDEAGEPTERLYRRNLTVDVIEEAAPGVVTITEFEEAEVREEGQEQPEETPPESEER